MAAISGLEAHPTRDTRTAWQFGEAGLLASATLLMLWPALYNGFPLIFSDTGTYISQAMEFHLGWDRPPFYSFFILALDWGQTLWPPTILQCVAAAWLIRRVHRMITPDAGIVAGCLLLVPLATLTSLPWTAAQIMPDIFTPMMVLALAILVLDVQAGTRERRVLMAIIGLAITVHLSNPPIYAGLCVTSLAACSLRGIRVPWRHVLIPFGLGVLALVGVNVIASGRISPSPYGSTFLLARLLSDGPARATLARDCPQTHWALCADQAAIPHLADNFLWRADSPLYRAGGPVKLIDQTQAIVVDTIVAEPGAVLRQAAVDFVRQLITFTPGSGLRPWRKTAAPTIERDIAAPAADQFSRSLQANGRLRVPEPLRLIADGLAVLGMALTALFVVVRIVAVARRQVVHHGRLLHDRLLHDRLFVFSAMVLLALLGNAAVTGALSGPHDRYQSRLVWIAVLSGALIVERVYSAYRSRPISRTA